MTESTNLPQTPQNSLYLNTLNGVPSSRTRPPVWFMRQAGRALKSYRNLKERYSFSEMLYTPELAAEITLLPLKSLSIDALILFSDILVVLEGMGIEVDYSMIGLNGPKIIKPLRETGGQFTVNRQPEKFERVYQTIKHIKQREIEIPLIGFCGSPLTIFLYLFQGSGHGGNFEDALKFFYTEPTKTDEILKTITEVSIEYSRGQVAQGVDAFQIFETWAGIIPTEIYFKRVMPWVTKLAEQIKVPIVFFPRLFSLGYQDLHSHTYLKGISIDFITSLKQVAPLLKNFCIQGNLDPHLVKHADKATLSHYLNDYLKFYKEHPRWIVNLGHGVLPNTPEENLQFVVEKIKNYQ